MSSEVNSESQYTCPYDGCTNAYDTARGRDQHHALSHGTSLTQEQAHCRECGTTFTYYPSDKDGVYCEECAKNPDVTWGGGCGETLREHWTPSHPPAADTPSEVELLSELETHAIGDVSELQIAAALMRRGCVVNTPFSDNQRYDFIVDGADGYYAVQCKTGRYDADAGVITIPMKSSRRKAHGFEHEDYIGAVDAIASYCPETGDVYWIPIEDATRSSMTLRVDPARHSNNQINWATEYLLDSQEI